MDWLNYHHLLYFWTVAKEGSITRASVLLDLAQPTISAQLHTLEESLGEPLFVRTGRNLTLTDFGRFVFRYADQIFTLGKELQNAVQSRPSSRGLKLTVGVTEVLPKLMVHRILRPAVEMAQPVQLVCHEGKPERLIAEMSVLGLDMILSDIPVPTGGRTRAYSHLLGVCGVSFLATPELVARARSPFPQSLGELPLLLPTEGTALRRSIDLWFGKLGIRPTIAAEFYDSALSKVFGEAGTGVIVAPQPIEDEVRRTFQVIPIGRTDEVQERYYVISAERKFKHPAVVAISDSAHNDIFAPQLVEQ